MQLGSLSHSRPIDPHALDGQLADQPVAIGVPAKGGGGKRQDHQNQEAELGAAYGPRVYTGPRWRIRRILQSGSPFPGTTGQMKNLQSPPDTPAPRLSPGKRLLRRVPAWILVIYLVWFTVASTFQASLIYPRSMAGPPLPEVAVPRNVEKVWITAKDGSKVEAWFVPANGASPDHPAPAAIFFHGNAELIDHNLSLVERYHERGFSVLMPEFRGYGRSGGSPSQDAIVSDAAAFWEWLGKRPDVDTKSLIIHGRSLGTGVAAQLAAIHQPAALILESPYTSIASFAWRYGVPPIFPEQPVPDGQGSSQAHLPDPDLGMASSDEIVPIEHGRKLHALAPTSTIVEMDGSHNSGLSEQNVYWEAVDGVIARSLTGCQPVGLGT